jgi:hypothetical protein
MLMARCRSCNKFKEVEMAKLLLARGLRFFMCLTCGQLTEIVGVS